MIAKRITDLIGNTPLLFIDPSVHGLQNIDLYAKLEYLNPFGSVKDRIAWGMIKDDIQSIKKEKREIIEASSGNTAKALQILASIHNVSFTTFVNRTRVPEVKHTLRLLGAKLEESQGLSECPDPYNPNDVFSVIAYLIAENPQQYYYPSQYVNKKNVQTHYETTGKEIVNDLTTIDYLFGGLGTTGSTRGVAERIKKHNHSLQTIGIVATPDDFIPGIRNSTELWEVGLFEKDLYKAIIEIDSKDAIESVLKLVKKSGILAGPTTGAIYSGAIEYLQKIDKKVKKRQTAVFIACDRIESYMSYFMKRKPELFGINQHHLTLQTITQKEINSTPQLTTEEMVQTIKEKSPLILDIRGNMAYRIGHIPGSINISMEIIEDLLIKGNPFPLKQIIVCVCGIGDQSHILAAFLRKKTYKAFNLKGGITAWKQAKYKLDSAAKPL